MSLDRKTLLFFSCLLGLVACGPQAQESTPTVTLSLATETPVPTLTATLTASPTEVATSSPTPIVVKEVDANLPPGLLLTLGTLDEPKSLWIVESSTELRRVAEEIAPALYYPDFDVSSDGQRILYAYRDDIWLLEVASGQTANVTQTPDRIEHTPRWWRDGFICGSVPLDQQEFQFIGWLAYVSFAGTYQVLDESGALAAPPAPGAVGIAYSTFGTESRIEGWLYYLDKGQQEFDPTEYGFEGSTRFWEASWSPEGNHLTWAISDDNEQIVIVLFDLIQQTHQVIHRYTPAPIGDFARAARWDPLGEWLTFYGSDSGVWGYDLTAQSLFLIGSNLSRPTWVNNPAISLDGRWIAVLIPTQTNAVAIINTESWEVQEYSLSENVSAVGWATVP